jgi:integrase
MSTSRKNSYQKSMLLFEKAAGAPFEEIYLDRKKINDILASLSKPPISLEDSTWNLCLGVYKRYAKWLHDQDDIDCPKVWRRIKSKRIDWEGKLKSKWLTEAEFLKLLDVIDDLCFKALFCTTVAGACRAGEVLGCKVGDVKISGAECKVTVTGKTGTRTFVMNHFAPILIQWLNFHPFKHDDAAPLWTRNRIRCDYSLNMGRQRNFVNTKLARYCKQAGIKKPVSMHWLRHSKVTWTARSKLRVNDKVANAMFGWRDDSSMYNRYTHLMATDTEDTFRLLDGVEPSEKVEDRGKILQRLKCFGCNELNLAGSLYCFRCGLPLTGEAAEEKVAKERYMADLYAKFAARSLKKRNLSKP